MASTYKVLAQSAPSATTNTDVYTVGSGKSAVVSTITVANEDYIAYDANVPANDTISLTIGITLAATDVVTVYASTANLSFNIFGAEIA